MAMAYDPATWTPPPPRWHSPFPYRGPVHLPATDWSLYDLYTKMEMPIVPLVDAMMRNGMGVDREVLSELSEEFALKQEEHTAAAADLIGVPAATLNLASTDQMRNAMFDLLEIRPVGKTPGGQWSTDENAIKKIQEALDVDITAFLKMYEDNGRKTPIVAYTNDTQRQAWFMFHLLEFRQFDKLKDSYVDKMLLLMDENNRIYTTLKQTRVVSGRLSSSEPFNLMAIPKDGYWAKRIRKAFRPRPGYSHMALDFSQIEMRVTAHASHDPNMMIAFITDQDIHTMTAAQMFNLPLDQVDPDLHRYPAKRVGFGCVPMDTEALTPTGWVKYDGINVGDLVMARNPDTGFLEWTPVEEKVWYPEAPLVEIGHSWWKATTTPTHRWPVRRRGTYKGVGEERKYVERFTTTSGLTAEESIIISAPAITEQLLPITPDEADLIGWWYGDGWGKEAPEFTLYQVKEEGKARIEYLLDQCGASYYTVLRASYPGYVEYRVSKRWARDLWERAQLANGPEALVLSLSPTHRARFLSGLWGADGHSTWDSEEYRDGNVLCQNEGPVLNAAQLALFLCGKRATITHNPHHASDRSRKLRPCKPSVSGNRIVRKSLPGLSPVWCIKTKFSTWVMRQGKEIMLTGNTQFGLTETGLLPHLPPINRNVEYARAFIERYFTVYAKVRQLINDVVADTRRYGFTKDLFGRMRYMPEVSSAIQRIRAEGERECFSHFIQGTAQGCIKLPMGDTLPLIEHYKLDCFPLIQIHDEMDFEIRTDQMQDAAEMFGEAYANGVKLDIPIKVEVEGGPSWGEMKKLATITSR